jgi:hypothetical protein
LNTDPGWPRARVDGDERRLRALALPLGQHLVDAREAVADRFVRQALEVRVERRVHVDGAARDVAEFVLQLLADVIDEIRRLGVERARRDQQGFP